MAGCDSAEPRFSERTLFAEAQGLPEIRDDEILFQIPNEDVTVFEIEYGLHRPNECLDLPGGGCYSAAFGISHRDMIGWIDVLDRFGDADGLDLHFFDFDAGDSYLFSEQFFATFELEERTLFYGEYLPHVIASPHATHAVLVRIAERLHDFIAPYLGELLLEHPIVLDSPEILGVLASIPVYQGDLYEETRQRAAERLAHLENN